MCNQRVRLEGKAFLNDLFLLKQIMFDTRLLTGLLPLIKHTFLKASSLVIAQLYLW